MDAKFYKSLNLLSKNFSQKLNKSNKILILFDENVDGLSSALIFLDYLRKKDLDVEIEIYRRNGFKEFEEKDLAIILDIPISREKIEMLKKIKNVFWFDDQRPKTFTFKKTIVINSYLYKVSLPTSSLCYYFFQNIGVNKSMLFFSYLGMQSEYYNVSSIDKKFKTYFSEEEIDKNLINSLHYFLRKEKDKKIYKFINKITDNPFSLIYSQMKKYYSKLEKIYKKVKIKKVLEKFDFGLTRIAAEYIYEKSRETVVVSSFAGKNVEITIRAPNEILNEIIRIKELEEYEFFVNGAEILTNKDIYKKIINHVSK